MVWQQTEEMFLRNAYNFGTSFKKNYHYLIISFSKVKVVIPQRMQSEMICYIRTSPLGLEKSELLARDVLFWPGMTSQIEDTSQVCSTNQWNNAEEPEYVDTHNHRIPIRPKRCLPFSFNGKNSYPHSLFLQLH